MASLPENKQKLLPLSQLALKVRSELHKTEIQKH